jgi:DNA repair exonuclease SbcCD nuclease subunit
MDYAALGHIHSYSGLRQAGETYYAWPGCPEGRGFDETGDKGVILAQVSPGACQLQFLPLGGRKYEVLSVDISQSQDVLATLEAALPTDTSRDVYRIRLTGQTDQTPPLSALQRALEGRFFGLELRDETHLRRDIWAQRDADSLKGLFLSRLWQQLEAAETDQERELVTQAARWGLQAIDGGEELPL